MELFDSHAHYNDGKFNNDRDEIIDSIYKSGVTRMVNAGYSLESSEIALKTAKNHDWIFTISGISPNDIPENDEDLDYELDKLDEFIQKNINSNKIVAIRRNWTRLPLEYRK